MMDHKLTILLFLFILGNSAQGQVYEPDSFLNAPEGQVEVQEDSAVTPSPVHPYILLKDSINSLLTEKIYLLQLQQNIDQFNEAIREPINAYIEELIYRIDTKIASYKERMIWKDSYHIALILPFRSDVMGIALDQWQKEMLKEAPSITKLTIPKTVYQNYDLYDGVKAFLEYRGDTTFEMHLSIWDNFNSLDSINALIGIWAQDPPDFIIGPGYGNKSSAMLRSILNFANTYDAGVFDPACTTLDTAMLHGNYVSYQPSYLETFYSSLALAASKDSASYIIIFQPDTAKGYSKLLDQMRDLVYRFNAVNGTALTPIVYDVLKAEELARLDEKCIIPERNSFIHFPTKNDQLLISFYDFLAPIIRNEPEESSVTAVGLDDLLDTKGLKYKKIMNANITFPMRTSVDMDCLSTETILKIQQATGLNPSESFYLGFEIISSIEQGILQGGKAFLHLPKDSLSLIQCDTTDRIFSLEEAPYFGEYENVITPAYWQSYDIQWMKLNGMKAVPYLERAE